jgi:p-hydroxybenzoate 3-monooxygenase
VKGELMPDVLAESATVVIVGAGVAGMTAAAMLRHSGIDCVVLERQSRDYVEQRQRAGVLEYRAARMFGDWGLAGLLGDFPADDTLEIRVGGESHLVLIDPHGGRPGGTLIPQQILLRNLISAFLDGGGDLRFGAADVELRDLAGERAAVGYTDEAGQGHEIGCSFVAGCDGEHGITRRSVPDGAITVHTEEYGIGWLTVLAVAPPPRYPLMAVSSRGFAAQFSRGPRASRFYLQCAPDARVADWPADRIWAELRARLGQGGLPGGEITEREVFGLRGLVCEPMSYRRLYLLGDAAHIIPPMGGKGMNMALHDAEVFARAVRDFVRQGDETGLRDYSAVCLQHTWTYQEFSRWMMEMMHDPGQQADPFRARLARARLDRLLRSETAAREFGELMAGLA